VTGESAAVVDGAEPDRPAGESAERDSCWDEAVEAMTKAPRPVAINAEVVRRKSRLLALLRLAFKAAIWGNRLPGFAAKR
jgi:hypothetical protein